MKSLEELITNRRSIRKYKAEVPSQEWIESMIRYATFAPSPSNTQAVRFLRISSENLKQALYESLVSGRDRFLKALKDGGGPKRLKNWINTYYRYSQFMFDAPVLFAVGTLRSATGFSKKMFEAGLLETYERKDPDIALGLALKGFILKGEALGLGSCILTAPLVFMEEVEEIMGTEDLDIRCLITVGFSDETPVSIKRKSVEEVYQEI